LGAFFRFGPWIFVQGGTVTSPILDRRPLSRGLSRGDLKELGEELEAGNAAVIVIGESKIEEQLKKRGCAHQQADREADRRRRRRAQARDRGGGKEDAPD
jgi:hypothetical protein